MEKLETALERQVIESLNIVRASEVPEECLNLKTEWGGSKLPAIEVSRPKGTSGKKDDTAEIPGDTTQKEKLLQPTNQGSKRIRQKETRGKEEFR